MSSGGRVGTSRRGAWLLRAGVIAVVLATLVPLLWVLLSSLRTTEEIFSSPIGFPAPAHWENFSRAWVDGNFGRYFVNSLVIAVATTLMMSAVACPAGYAFARSRGRGVRIAFYVYLAAMTLPLQAVIIPIFYQLKHYGLLNTRLGLTLVLVGTGMPFAAFLMRNFYRDLPSDVFEAAQVDGASELQTFLLIALPLAMPALKALAVFTFLLAWNEYLLALLVLLNEPARTIPLGLVRFQEAHSADYGALFAGIVMAMVPSILIYLSLQRSFTEGISAGGSKG